MAALKPFIFIFLLVFLLYIMWGFKSDTPAPVLKEKTSSTVNSSTASDPELLQRISQLETDLQDERLQRLDFEQRIYKLEQLLKSSSESNDVPLPVTELEPQNTTNAITLEKSDEEIRQQLILANIPLDTIQRIQDLIGKNRLAMLELRDKATRENWLNTLEYSEQMHQLRDPTKGIREEYGDEVYDAYLFASGQQNRVQVQQVYSGSAAEVAGIRAGDIVLNYANTRIFTMNDLRQATVKGEAGETVLVELIRDASPYSTTVPRGPLGISMTVTSLPPQ